MDELWKSIGGRARRDFAIFWIERNKELRSSADWDANSVRSYIVLLQAIPACAQATSADLEKRALEAIQKCTDPAVFGDDSGSTAVELVLPLRETINDEIAAVVESCEKRKLDDGDKINDHATTVTEFTMEYMDSIAGTIGASMKFRATQCGHDAADRVFKSAQDKRAREKHWIDISLAVLTVGGVLWAAFGGAISALAVAAVGGIGYALNQLGRNRPQL